MRDMLLGIPLLLLPAFALASPSACSGLHTQLEISTCMSNEASKETAAMQAAAKAYASTLDPNDRLLFKKAQTAWRAYMDATCKFSSAPLAGGSMQGADTAQCLSFLTVQRREFLEQQINCEKKSLRTDCLTTSARPIVNVPEPSPKHMTNASAEDIDRLTTYAAALGKGIACKANGINEASRRVGSWMDKHFPPGSDDQKTYLPVLTQGMELATRLQLESPKESCFSVRESFGRFPWP